MSSARIEPDPAIVEAAIELGARFSLDAAALDETARFPVDNLAELHRRGFFRAVVPPPFGSAGSLVEALKVVSALSKGEPNTGLTLALQYLLHSPLLRLDRDAPSWRLRARIAESAVEDGALINVLRVEHELGTPVRGGLPATIARRVTGGWRLTGRKIYSTGAGYLAWNAVWARSDDDAPLVGVWVTPRGAEGVGVVKSWNHLGMRASASDEVTFDDVFIPDDHALDIRRPEEWAQPDSVELAWTFVLFSAIYDGVARAARDWFIEFLKRRKPTNLGAALATVPRLQEALGEIERLLYINETLLFSTAAAVDRGVAPAATQTSFLKCTVADNSIAAVEKALSLTGNHGLSRHNPLQRHYRDVLCSRIHSPQSDTVLAAAGAAALR